MLNSILAICRAVFLILGGHKQVLENIALRQQLGIFQRSVRRPKIRPVGPTVLGVSAESLERVEVGVGVCSARNRGRLGKGGDSNDSGPGCPGTRIPVGLEPAPTSENW